MMEDGGEWSKVWSRCVCVFRVECEGGEKGALGEGRSDVLGYLCVCVCDWGGAHLLTRSNSCTLHPNGHSHWSTKFSALVNIITL